jgi:2-polyprenyl-3-methyl-5-hydroxy-6-metoxy-1,4-benzoquinol methylase
LLIGHLVAAIAQEAHPVTGREIAPVMGMGGADWLVRPERIAEEAPDKALDAIGLKKGDVVADIGAGVGYFSWRMAERVGPTGKVYANDIQPRMLDQLKKNVASRRAYECRAGAGGGGRSETAGGGDRYGAAGRCVP